MIWGGAPWSVAASVEAIQGTDATVNLVAVTATGAVGTFTPSDLISLSGVAATGGVGTFTPSDLIPLTGAAATGAVGTFDLWLLAPLDGVAGTGVAGDFGPELLIDLGDVSGMGFAGTLGFPSSVTLDGITGTSAAGTFDFSLLILLVGAAGTGAAGDFGPELPASLTSVAATGAAGDFGPSLLLSLTGAAATGAAGDLLPASHDATFPLVGVYGSGATGVLTPVIIYSVAPNGRWRAIPSPAYLHRQNARTDLSPQVNEGGFTLYFDIPMSASAVGQFFTLTFTAPSGRSFTTQGTYYGQNSVGGYLIIQRTFLAHVTLENEFDEIGLWSVYATSAGQWQSDYGYFRVVHE